MSDQKRSDRFELRLEPSETKSLRILAKQCGMTKSEFLRFCIRNYSVPPMRKKPRVEG